MARTLTLYDLEESVYGSRSEGSKTGRQRGLRRVLKILGQGVGKGNRYEWTDQREFISLVAKIDALRKSLC